MGLSVGKSKSRYILFISIVLALLFAFIIFKPFGSNGSKNVPVSISSSCAVDKINGASFVEGVWVATKNSPIIVQGWVSDPNKKIPAEKILVQLMDKEKNVLQSITEKSDFDRPDVEKAYNNPAMKFSGYNISLAPVTEPGDYIILLGSSYPNLKSICTTTTNLRISE